MQKRDGEEPSRAEPLSRDELAARVRDRTYTHYMDMNALVKGGVGLIAANTLIHVADRIDKMGWPPDPRLPLWFASVLLSLVTFVTSARGSLMTNARQNLGDYVLPISVGFSEFVMFLILDPQILADAPRSLFIWLVTVSFHTWFAFFLVYNRYKQLTPKEDFAPKLWQLAENFQNWLWRDKFLAFLTAMTLTVVTIWCFRWLFNAEPPTSFSLAYVATLIAMSIIGISILIFNGAIHQSQKIAEYVMATDRDAK